ncbi:MAG TPA: hypothetical protein VMB47_05390 [Candidatus Aquilonibacter sp.]|nr:hypothetical protein [Candidatus Aquilonibacter sp.]
MKTNRFALLMAAAAALCAPAALMAKHDIGDYALRLHIYQTNWNHNVYGYHAFGRANLFDEHGAPHGVEYTYDCEDHLMASNSNEAYPARWKKSGQSIEVIFGEIGQKPGDFHACEFKLAMKSFVFYRHNGMVDTESPQDFMAHNSDQAPTPGATDVPVAANPSHRY